MNDLTPQEWIKFTKSWFILSGKPDPAKTSVHPATFPFELPAEFIRFFTQPGQCVLDPFSGTGTTLAAAGSLERQAIGIDIEPRFVEFSRTRTGAVVHTGDALTLLEDPTVFAAESIGYVFTSPPYMDALRRSRGGNRRTRHKDRQEKGEELLYGDHLEDLGNLTEPDEYIGKLVSIFRGIHRVLKERSYCTVVLQNLNVNGGTVPIAWKFATAMSETGLWDLKGEKIWCQENKRLGIYGYPSAYATNNFHHYCLTFRNSPSGVQRRFQHIYIGKAAEHASLRFLRNEYGITMDPDPVETHHTLPDQADYLLTAQSGERIKADLKSFHVYRNYGNQERTCELIQPHLWALVPEDQLKSDPKPVYIFASLLGDLTSTDTKTGSPMLEQGAMICEIRWETSSNVDHWQHIPIGTRVYPYAATRTNNRGALMKSLRLPEALTQLLL